MFCAWISTIGKWKWCENLMNLNLWKWNSMKLHNSTIIFCWEKPFDIIWWCLYRHLLFSWGDVMFLLCWIHGAYVCRPSENPLKGATPSFWLMVLFGNSEMPHVWNGSQIPTCFSLVVICCCVRAKKLCRSSKVTNMNVFLQTHQLLHDLRKTYSWKQRDLHSRLKFLTSFLSEFNNTAACAWILCF